jgi:hypothetical protein
MNVLRALVLVVLLSANAAAQTRPDFAGRWTTDPDPAAAAAAGGGGGAGAAAGGRAGGGGAGGAAGAGAAGRAGAGGGRGAPASMGSGWGSTIAITQDASSLTVEYAFFGRGDMQAPIKYTFALDGSPTRNTIMMGRGMEERVSSAAWQGVRLTITTTSTMPNPAGSGAPVTTELQQVLSLESPTSLVVETTRAAFMGGASSTTRSVYRKL